MRWNPVVFGLAVVIFLASALVVLYALERESSALAITATVGMGIAAVLFLLSLFGWRRRVDWRRVEAEQRLWESGPLGKTWLRARQRLSRLWKI